MVDHGYFLAADTTQFKVIIINSQETLNSEFDLSFHELTAREMMKYMQGGIIYEIWTIISIAGTLFLVSIYLMFRPKNMINENEVDDNFKGHK